MKIDKTLRNKQGIYVLRISSHLYVGSTCNLYHRLYTHFWALKRGSHDNLYLQRSVNKYGYNNLSYEIAELCPHISVDKLLERELYYITKLQADLNLKKDPTTEQNCITTSKSVFQFTPQGVLIKEWQSASEASRYYGVFPSNISGCCLYPDRQKLCKGFLWSYQNPYPFNIKPLIYAFDLDGVLVGEYKSTVDIYISLYQNLPRKTVLSQLKGKIDRLVPYKGYYLSTDRNMVLPDTVKTKFRKPTSLDIILQENPLIYIYDRSNKLLGTEYLNNLPHKRAIVFRIKQGTCYKYSVFKRNPTEYASPTRTHKCKAQSTDTGEIFIFNTAVAAAVTLFGDKKFANHIRKHTKRHTPFMGFNFWDL